MRLREFLSISALAAGGAFVAAAGRAQGYGTDLQVLTIGAAEFLPYVSSGASMDANGYVRSTESVGLVAPLNLPEGVRIEKLCFYVDDSDADVGGFVDAAVVVTKLAPGGNEPESDVVGEAVYSEFDVGYAYYCSDPFSYTLRSRTDVDGDGIDDAAVYYVRADVPPAQMNSLGLGGVQITWRRQVSAPPPVPTFGDVPSTDTAFPHIEALVASGITAGCGGGNYCPEASLSRRQMAVFLAKALGLQWAD